MPVIAGEDDGSSYLSGTATCDVVVIGTGAAGLTAAVTAKLHGREVVVLEKAPLFGGMTASSAGGTWIPCNPIAARAGISDSIDAARTYFRAVTGNGFDAARVEAFLENGPKMVQYLEDNTSLKFTVQKDRPDYYPSEPGAMNGGRTIYPVPFDGRLLGAKIARLRPPMRELTFLGIMIKPGPDLLHFLNAFRSFRSAGVVARRLARHFRDVALHGRPMDISNGNAIIAHLAKSAFDLGIPILTSVEAEDLVKEDGRIVGVKFRFADRTGTLGVRAGVVLASGGFPHDVARRRDLYRHAPTGAEHVSPAPETSTGDGMRMAERAGGFVPTLSDAAAWAPVSLVPRRGRKPGVFPHLIDRQKPGFIAVTRHGERFVNEADSYHEFCRGLAAACAGEPEAYCFLVADHRTIRRYGIGFAKPAPVPLFPYLRSGYLLRGATLQELAERAGIEPQRFLTTVENFNTYAREGRDPQFKRGESTYNRYNGDALHKPNPCVAPIEQGPFYAVRMVIGELGTFAGVATDDHARVLDRDMQPIPGLYAAGSDMSHVMSGSYLAGGATLGPGMTFGYVAGCDLASPKS